MKTMYEIVITYKSGNNTYQDRIGDDCELSFKEAVGMFEMNHAMSGDLQECRIVSVNRYLK